MLRLVSRALLQSVQQQQRYSKIHQWIFMQRCSYHSLFIQPPRDQTPELTTIKLTQIFAAEIGQAREYSLDGLNQTQKTRESLMDLLPQPDDILPPRKMKDSFVSAIVPLKTNPDIRERYVTVGGKVRIGRLLEDLDVFAVYCCFKHILNPRSVGKPNPYSVVTAMVDSIHIVKDFMQNDQDVRLSGHVTFAGKSSMEVCIIVDQKDANGVYQKYFDAVFLMVARDPMNKGSARINPLSTDTPEEIEFLKKGAERQRIRKQEESQSILKIPPLKEEMEIIHHGFLERLKNPGLVNSKVKKLKDSVLRTVLICQPQYRNRYNKIFGGFLMRQAYELAFTNTFIHGKGRPRILNIDNIKFQQPVEIGSIIRFLSYIGYVEQNFVHTVVVADIINPLTGLKLRSNELHFNFVIPVGNEEGGASENEVPEIEFDTYEDAMNYLHSRRHFKKMMEDFHLLSTSGTAT